MEAALRARCPPRAGKPGPGPEAGAGHGSQAGLGSQLCSPSLGHCCAWPMPALAHASAGPSAEQGLVPGLAVSAPGLSPGPTAASPSIPVPHLPPPVEQWLPLAGLPVGIRLALLRHCGSALMNTGHNHPGELLPPEKLLPPQRAALLGVTAAGIWSAQGHDTDPRHNGLWARCHRGSQRPGGHGRPLSQRPGGFHGAAPGHKGLC